MADHRRAARASGTVRCNRDMDWTSDTGRSAGAWKRTGEQVALRCGEGPGTRFHGPPFSCLLLIIRNCARRGIVVAFAAGSKFRDDGVAVDDNDPSKRWIARYEREADRAPSDPGTRTFGAFGSNENGLQDVGGNVWVQTNGIDGVMSCTRCGAQADQPTVAKNEPAGSESIVPTDRPWLEPPFMVPGV